MQRHMLEEEKFRCKVVYSHCPQKPELPFSPPVHNHPPTLPPLSRGGDGPPDASTTLSGVQTRLLTVHNLWWFLNNFVTFGKNHFNVARVWHVGVDLIDQSVICFSNSPHREINEFLRDIGCGDVLYRGHGMCVSSAWGPGWLGCAWRSGCQYRDPWCRRWPQRSWADREGTRRTWRASGPWRHRIACLLKSISVSATVPIFHKVSCATPLMSSP